MKESNFISTRNHDDFLRKTPHFLVEDYIFYNYFGGLNNE